MVASFFVTVWDLALCYQEAPRLGIGLRVNHSMSATKNLLIAPARTALFRHSRAAALA